MNMNQFLQKKYEYNVNTLKANNHCCKSDFINKNKNKNCTNMIVLK